MAENRMSDPEMQFNTSLNSCSFPETIWKDRLKDGGRQERKEKIFIEQLLYAKKSTRQFLYDNSFDWMHRSEKEPQNDQKTKY